MKKINTLLFFIICSLSYGQIITEIMYNPPESGADSLEYVEFYNNTGADIELENYFTTGVDLTFGPQTFAAGQYLVIAKNRAAFDGIFQAPTTVWLDGALNNSGESVSLFTPDSILVDAVMYSKDSPWPINGAGEGYSIELCDLTADNDNPANWGFSTFDTGMIVNGKRVFGSPAQANQPDCSIVGVEYTDIAINEIMYNGPGDADTLEYIELFNHGADTVSMSGWMLAGDINYSLPPLSLLPNTYLVLSKNQPALANVFGASSFSWSDEGKLGDLMGSIRLISNLGTLIDEVNYTNQAPWPVVPEGTAITLCNIQGDHNAGESWIASTTAVENENIPGLYGSPNKINKCGGLSIGEITAVDSLGNISMSGAIVTTTGVVYGINMRPSGLQFTVIDDNNDGIGVFSFDENLGYTVNQGDNITITGEVSQFNGLAQISPTSIVLNTTGNLLFDPTVVTQLSEETESQLIRFENMTVIDPSQWTGAGSGFNVDISNGTDTVAMRIDADVPFIYDETYPTGVFTVTGIGGQFDNSEPYDSGYQILPRFFEDIDPYVPFIPEVDNYPAKTIAEMTTVDSLGIVDSLGVACSLTGIVYGVNLSTNDLVFTIIDDENNGIGVFENGAFTYEVLEGDMVTLKGTIGQFNGLTQMLPDSIILLSQENGLIDPEEITELSEDTESSFVTLNNVSLVDPSVWYGDGTSFNVEFTDGTITHTVRIDNDTYWANQPPPVGDAFTVIGIGGQFDNSEPYDSGYQLFPRYESDIVFFDPNFDPFPTRTIAEMTTVDAATGVADSVGVNCTLTGTVYGVNLSGSDLIMTIIDDNNEGIGVFENDNVSGYVVTEGDIVTIKGTIGQFNGLTQINPASVILESQGNDLVTPPLVTALDESTESSLVRIGLVSMVDPTQWAGDGSSFNLNVVDEDGNEYIVRIDNDVDLANLGAPPADATFAFTGIGGQFDSSDPYDSGYQLLPRYIEDMMVVLSTFDEELASKIKISPNPTSDFLNIETDASIDKFNIYNALGQMLISGNFENAIDVSDLPEGNYSILFRAGDKLSSKRFIKIN